MTRTEPAAATAPPDRAAQSPLRPRVWAALAAAAVITAVSIMQLRALAPGALSGDLGIQYHLAAATARGSVPLLDFHHTWNVASWYFSAALYRVAGGDATIWVWLWAGVTGRLLAGLAAIGIAWRLRLRAPWILVVAGSWLALSHVLHSKYAVPILWLLAVLPVGVGAGARPAIAVRAALGAITFLAHVELAVLLAAGTALFDLFGARDLGRRERLLRASAAPAGMLLALGGQTAIYAALGLTPSRLLSQILLDPGATFEAFNFGYPLLLPANLRPLLFPVSVIVPFVPLIWRRLSDPARMTAFLHLALSLIAIRRVDPAHVDAATTLLGLLAALVAHDLLTAGRPVQRRPDALPSRIGLAILGGAWLALAITAGFRIPSLLAIVGLTLLALGGVAVARRSDATWASAGALAAAAVLLVAGAANRVAEQARSGDDDSAAQQIAAGVAGPLRECIGEDERVWVVPEPLGLYDSLGVRNPTPYWVFWYGFATQHDEVRDLIGQGEIPAILQVGDSWPASFDGLGDDIEAAYSPCATVELSAVAGSATVWIHPRD
ncbi:MAG TPA: hypothetical protein VML96_13150 [Egibacteraceae bacterium]|nr:hypothetical protein [Egibacteraceae bacterium]